MSMNIIEVKNYNILIETNNIIKNIKLSAVNIIMYCLLFPGLWRLYSLKVIRLAREAISVPTPPIFTPISKSL